jgi:glycosyltransferase involved in cell wall biosynthesis
VRISVALCAYNGEAYLHQQLETILSQTRKPDEMVVCDDLSGDNTLAILENFKERAHFSVLIYCNQEHVGSTKNFEKAIGLCSGDIIALSDQDDVWHQEKVERIEEAFLDSPSVGAVVSDSEMVDGDLNPLGYTLWRSLKFTGYQQRRVSQGNAFEVLLKHNFVAGISMAFRAEFKDFILPIPANWVHDGWIGLILSAVSDFALIPEQLNKYRQHETQQIGAKRQSLLTQLFDAEKRNPSFYLSVFEQYREAYKRLEEIGDRLSLKTDVEKIKAKMAHMYRRAHLPRGKGARFLTVSNDAVRLRYYRYSDGWKSAMRDLIYGG